MQTDTRPRRLGARLKHFWLAQRMAKRTGVDVCAAYEAGDLNQDDWKALVEKCRACAWTEGCQRFLNRADTELRPIPDGCENKDTLKHLRDTRRS